MVASTFLLCASLLTIYHVGLLDSTDIQHNTHPRMRRTESTSFVRTTCMLIDLVSKDRCTTSDHGETSCVTDEQFRVQYRINGTMTPIKSSIITYGKKFPRLMQVGENATCFYDSQNISVVRWTLLEEKPVSNVNWWSRVTTVFGVVMIVVGFCRIGYSIFK